MGELHTILRQQRCHARTRCLVRCLLHNVTVTGHGVSTFARRAPIAATCLSTGALKTTFATRVGAESTAALAPLELRGSQQRM